MKLAAAGDCPLQCQTHQGLSELKPLEREKLKSPNKFHPQLNGRRCAPAVMFISKVYVILQCRKHPAVPQQLQLNCELVR